MLNNWLKCFTIQININDESTSVNENSSLFIKKNQNELIIENEIM